MELQGRNYLDTVGYYSNFWEVDRRESTKYAVVIRTLKAHFARYGSPSVLISDNGPQFIVDKFRKFPREWDFEHRTSSLTHAKSNGINELAVKTAKRLLKKQQTVVEINTSPHWTTGIRLRKILIRTHLSVTKVEE